MALAKKTQNKQHDIPLLVDLDGSLINTDTLYETAVLFLKKYPWMFFMLIVWLAKGMPVLKRELATRTELDVDSLPYRQDVLDYLQGEHEGGRNIILFSGSWVDIVNRIAEKFQFIEATVATNSERNLTGSGKAEYASKRWGEDGFDYLGNEEKDLLVWKNARKAVVVGDQKLFTLAKCTTEVAEYIQVKPAGIKTWLKAVRIHQWAKNALLFVPLLTSQQFTNVESIFNAFIGFVCFGVCASATYILNDLLDLESDRKHHIKKFRPLAAGSISIPQGVLAGVFLMCLGILLAAFLLNTYFLLTLIFYILLTTVYSFKLKSLQTIDVILLASLFTIRIIAGGAAIEVALSFWLLCFSMFIFLSLALVKRVSELINAEKYSVEKSNKISGRGYFTADIVVLQSLGTSSGFMAVLVFALYINSEEVTKLYKYPQILWLICPVLGYWIMRVWMLTARNEMDEDPISFAIFDRNSWLTAIMILCTVIAASYFE